MGDIPTIHKPALGHSAPPSLFSFSYCLGGVGILVFGEGRKRRGEHSGTTTPGSLCLARAPWYSQAEQNLSHPRANMDGATDVSARHSQTYMVGSQVLGQTQTLLHTPDRTTLWEDRTPCLLWLEEKKELPASYLLIKTPVLSMVCRRHPHGYCALFVLEKGFPIPSPTTCSEQKLYWADTQTVHPCRHGELPTGKRHD